MQAKRLGIETRLLQLGQKMLSHAGTQTFALFGAGDAPEEGQCGTMQH